MADITPEPTGWPVVGSIIRDYEKRNLIAVWECPECFALTARAENHRDVCRAAAARRKAPCSIRAGQLLTATCACGHTGYVHGRIESGGIGCTICPPT